MKKELKKEAQPGFISFFLRSKAAFLLIILNVVAFDYVYFSDEARAVLSDFILSPGALMQGRWWTLVTSGFIHHDGMHLFFNMLGVFVFAPILERRLGVAKTLFVYFGSLIISMLFASGIYAFLMHQNVAIIGASGAVMGLISAAMLLDPFCITFEMILPIPVMIKGWMFLAADLKGFLGGEKDGISHTAHLCGFVSVAILMYFLAHEDKKKMLSGLIINVISFVVFLYVKHKYFG